MKKSYITAFSVAGALAASAGVASADPAGGQYVNKSTVTSIGTGTNATTCTALQQKVGTVTYAFNGYTPATSTAKGVFNGVADAAGTYYVEDASIAAGAALVGTTLTASIWAETFNNFGQLTPGSSPIGTISILTKSATATTTGYTVITVRTLKVGSATCHYGTRDAWVKIG